MGELFWILNRLKSKNPLCKRMIESISPSTTPWVSTKQDLNWVVMEILIISERCALPRKIRVQKSLSAISRVWEASEQGLQKEKAICFLPRISLQVGVPPQKPFSAAGWAPRQVWHHTCDHRATASAPRLRTGFDSLWNTSKNSSITYLRYKRPAWGLDGISPTLLCKKNSKKPLPKIHKKKKIHSFCSTWSINNQNAPLTALQINTRHHHSSGDLLALNIMRVTESTAIVKFYGHGHYKHFF